MAQTTIRKGFNRETIPTQFKYKKTTTKGSYKKQSTQYHPVLHSIYQKCNFKHCKVFLCLLNKYFAKFNKLHKIFYKNTVKMNFSCTEKSEVSLKNTEKSGKYICQVSPYM